MSNESDVKLLSTQVIVEAWDLCLDSPDRRKNQTPQRRALVHDFNDGLTVNWSNDYPGGVTINGLNRINSKEGITIKGKANVDSLYLMKNEQNTTYSLRIEANEIIYTIREHPFLRGNPLRASDGGNANAGLNPFVREINVLGEIMALREEVDKLKQQVTSN